MYRSQKSHIGRSPDKTNQKISIELYTDSNTDQQLPKKLIGKSSSGHLLSSIHTWMTKSNSQ